ncbi:hypothetical protein BDV09DRAFT_108581 [Aspergillus tetrazonus]
MVIHTNWPSRLTVGPASLDSEPDGRLLHPTMPLCPRTQAQCRTSLLLASMQQLSLHDADRLHFAAMLPKRGVFPCPQSAHRPETWPNETRCRLGSSSMTSAVSRPKSRDFQTTGSWTNCDTSPRLGQQGLADRRDSPLRFPVFDPIRLGQLLNPAIQCLSAPRFQFSSVSSPHYFFSLFVIDLSPVTPPEPTITQATVI